MLRNSEVVILFAAEADSAAGLLPGYGVLHGQLDRLGNVVLADGRAS